MRTEAGNFKSPSPIVFSSSVRWYVLANRSEAVIYKDTDSDKFKFVQRLNDPKGKLKESELDSDRPGRGNSGGSASFSLDRTFHHHEVEAREFAKKIAVSVTEATRDGRVDEIVLACEPHFLGLLRSALPASVKDLVKAEINHEYTYGSDEAIRGQILNAMEKLRQ
jgi:protein required for attachment to host cells